MTHADLVRRIEQALNDPGITQGCMDWPDDLPDILRDCLTALTQPSAEGWRPIATAPKDGTEVLLLERGARYIGVYNSHIGGWMVDGDWPVKPTRWAPLPSPPAEDV
jgi:hypothetical protein